MAELSALLHFGKIRGIFVFIRVYRDLWLNELHHGVIK